MATRCVLSEGQNRSRACDWSGLALLKQAPAIFTSAFVFLLIGFVILGFYDRLSPMKAIVVWNLTCKDSRHLAVQFSGLYVCLAEKSPCQTQLFLIGSSRSQWSALCLLQADSVRDSHQNLNIQRLTPSAWVIALGERSAAVWPSRTHWPWEVLQAVH